MSYRVAWCVLMLSFLAACAIPEPPPGGATDETPPYVTGTFPDSGTAGVAPDATIEFMFSEGMKRERVERLVTFSPVVRISKSKWKGNTMRLVLEEPLHPDTTYVVDLAAGFTDFHGVKGGKGYRFPFATSARLDSGRVSGEILFRRRPSKRARVRLFVLPKDSSFAPEAARPDRETIVDDKGKFEFDYLPTADRSVLVWAFEDENGNKRFDPEREAAQLLADTLLLSVESHAIAVDKIAIVDHKEPGLIDGTIVNATGNDTIPITVTLHAANDTLPPTHMTICGPEGNFVFGDALQGKYTLFGFIDYKADSLCGTFPCGSDSTRVCEEPCVQYPDTITVEPGGEVKLDSLVLEAAESSEE